MKFKSFDHFAIRTDYLNLFAAIESTEPVKYVVCGNFELRTVIEYHSISMLPNLGNISTGSEGGSGYYMILGREDEVAVAERHPEHLPSRFITSAEFMPDSIYFIPAGQYQDRYLVSGLLSCRADSLRASQLFGRFATFIHKHFVKVPHMRYRIGPDALRTARENPDILFTHDAKSPGKFTLGMFGID